MSDSRHREPGNELPEVIPTGQPDATSQLQRSKQLVEQCHFFLQINGLEHLGGLDLTSA